MKTLLLATSLRAIKIAEIPRPLSLTDHQIRPLQEPETLGFNLDARPMIKAVMRKNKLIQMR
jgi:hypothetical protein